MDGWAAYLKRAKSHRWLLVAALVIFTLLAVSGRIDPLTALLSGAAFVVASAFAPVQSRRDRVAANTHMVDRNQYDLQMQSLIDAVPDPVLVIGSRGEITAANSETHKTFGNIETGTDVMLRFRSPELQTIIRSALAGEPYGDIEYVETAPLESWFSVSLQKLKSKSSEQQFIMHFRDLDDSKRIDRVRSDFIANASHELRTPLASLTGFIETLAGPARNDAAAHDRFLKIMLEQAERMSRLIDDLLTLSRFETARGRANFDDVELLSVLNHVADTLRPMASQSGASVSVEVSKSTNEGYSVKGSRDELIQLFENLVENAIKYGKDNGKIRIGLDSDDSSSNVVVTVSDDGPGISEEHLPRLVERFYRVNIDTSRGKQGTGLGLSIVKHIIQRHLGHLNIKSTIGEGTTFVVTLPAVNEEKST